MFEPEKSALPCSSSRRRLHCALKMASSNVISPICNQFVLVASYSDMSWFRVLSHLWKSLHFEQICMNSCYSTFINLLLAVKQTWFPKLESRESYRIHCSVSLNCESLIISLPPLPTHMFHDFAILPNLFVRSLNAIKDCLWLIKCSVIPFKFSYFCKDIEIQVLEN